MPYAIGYVRLAMLEWANEVAKAARGTTNVATIEPPAHAPHVCDPVTDPATSAPPCHRDPVANRYHLSILGCPHGRELPEGRWWWAIFEVPVYQRGARFRAEHGCIDFPDRGTPFRMMIS